MSEATQSPPSEASIIHADSLYEQVNELARNCRNDDEEGARRIIELAEDAIREYGSTNQDKKVKLKQAKSEAENRLPPRNFEELRKRGEGRLLGGKVLRRYGFGVFLIVVTIGFLWTGWPVVKYVWNLFSPPFAGKTTEQQTQRAPSQSPPVDSNSVKELDENEIVASSESFTPVSMAEFFNTAMSWDLTAIQRSDFISQQKGRRVIWEGFISTVDESQNEITVGITDYDARFLYIAFFSFSTDRRYDFLNLKPRQKVKLTGILREWNVTTARLDSSRIVKIWPVETKKE